MIEYDNVKQLFKLINKYNREDVSEIVITYGDNRALRINKNDSKSIDVSFNLFIINLRVNNHDISLKSESISSVILKYDRTNNKE